MRYSAKESGFFPEYIEYPTLPDDLVEITEDEWRALLEGQDAGKIITAGKDGVPFLAEPAPLSQKELISIAEQQRSSLRVEADAAVTPLQDAVDLDDATEEETALLKKWKQYRVALSRLDLSTAPEISWPATPQ